MVSFVSNQNKPRDIGSLNFTNCQNLQLDPNDKFSMKNFVLSHKHSEFAVFDTFIAEEMYSLYVKNFLPNAIKILDTQDLHSIRAFRREKFNQLKEREMDSWSLKEVLPVPFDA